MSVAGIFHRPFAEQLSYFRQKLNLGTEHWDDILGAAHDRAFIVAGAMKADLLTDLRGAVDKAIANGTTLETFRKDFAAIVDRHGWSYRGGFDWRTRVIYETNLRASYAAGRWAQLNDPELARVAPYWRYKHSDSVLHPRPLHVSWDGLTLKRDDPWWQTHFPPNGWGCKCRVVAVRAKDLRGAKPDTAPDDGTYTHVDRRGVAHVIPKGIDYGWAHAPGSTWKPDLAKYPEQIAAQLAADARKVSFGWRDEMRREADDYVLARGRTTGDEHVVMIDQITGEEIARKRGTRDSVDLGEFAASLADPARRIYLTHNHPSNGSLSLADLHLGAMRGVAEVKAVGHGGSVFSARSLITDTDYRRAGVQPLIDAHRKANVAVRLTLAPQVRPGGIAFAEANEMHWHAVNHALARAGLIDYSATPGAQLQQLLARHADLFEQAVAAATERIAS